jgi:hypothetical protein
METDLIRFSVRHAGMFLMPNLFGQRLHPMLVKMLNITHKCKLKEYLQAHWSTNLNFFESALNFSENIVLNGT